MCATEQRARAFAELSIESNCTSRKTCMVGGESLGGRMTSRRRTWPYLSISSFVSSTTSATSWDEREGGRGRRR